MLDFCAKVKWDMYTRRIWTQGQLHRWGITRRIRWWATAQMGVGSAVQPQALSQQAVYHSPV